MSDEVRRWSLGTGELWLAIDSRHDGLTCGGLRLDPSATSDDAEQLAGLMTRKLAACHVPIGGAKAVVAPHPGADREQLLADVGRALADDLKDGYLLGEDLGTSAADVIAVYEAAGVDPVTLVRERLRARDLDVVPEGLVLADLMNDEFAGRLAGVGASMALARAADLAGFDLAGARVAVQGFGTVGHATAEALTAAGLRVVTIADVDGAVHAEAGFDLDTLSACRRVDGSIGRSELPDDVESVAGPSWTTWPVEVLVPAAAKGAVSEAQIEQLADTTRFVVEGANAPLTEAAEAALEERGVVVLPDFLANAGSAVAFGLLATGSATVDDVGERYTERIAAAVERAWSFHSGRRMREAALEDATSFLERTALETTQAAR
jgi:glutamate dehydrogenase (NAD(P)+)